MYSAALILLLSISGKPNVARVGFAIRVLLVMAETIITFMLYEIQAR